jgi:DNA recombination protein RmuC
MVEYCDFTQQEEVQNEFGKQRPDMVIRLPGNKIIVVDAKAPLADYLEALDATDEETKKIKMTGHARQVKTHITKLAAKAYWSQFDFTPEFVVMFLPGETFFSAALQFDPNLIEYGAEQGVIVSTPTTLIALLKAVAYGWTQEQINENARQISELGKTLYERISVLTDHLLDVRKGLQQTVQAYNKTVGSYESRVLVTARKFGELGLAGDHDIKEMEVLETGIREIAAADHSIEPNREERCF